MMNLTRLPAWTPSPYSPGLPPPLCFTVPAGDIPHGHVGTLTVGPTPRANLAPPRLMMDPSDATTWQRPYRFT